MNSKIKISEKGFYSKGGKNDFLSTVEGGFQGINRLEVIFFIWECCL